MKKSIFTTILLLLTTSSFAQEDIPYVDQSVGLQKIWHQSYDICEVENVCVQKEGEKTYRDRATYKSDDGKALVILEHVVGTFTDGIENAKKEYIQLIVDGELYGRSFYEEKYLVDLTKEQQLMFGALRFNDDYALRYHNTIDRIDGYGDNEDLCIRYRVLDIQGPSRGRGAYFTPKDNVVFRFPFQSVEVDCTTYKPIVEEDRADSWDDGRE